MSMRVSNAITLQQCEAVIKEGLEAFEKVERALRIIEEMKLYPEQYRDLQSYCDANWELPRGLVDHYPSTKKHVNKILSMPMAR